MCILHIIYALVYVELYVLWWCLIYRTQSSKNERKRKKISDSDRLFSRSSVTSHLVSVEGGREGGRVGRGG